MSAKFKKVIEGHFAKQNAAKYLNKVGFIANPNDFDKAEIETGYFERFNAAGMEAWAGFIAKDKIEIEVTKD